MSACNKDAYAVQIHCEDTSLLKTRMEFLFSKGFVFTDNRYTTWIQAATRYADSMSWRYINVGHSDTCSKIINTTCFRKSGKKDMTWDDFVANLMPLL